LAVTAMVIAPELVRAWVGPGYPAAGLVAFSLGTIVAAAPLQVGSNLLQGIGRAADVLRPAVVAVVVNLAASVVLVRWIGVEGTFMASLIGAGVLTVPLLRAVLRASGTGLREYLVASVQPVVWPVSAAAVVGAVVASASPLGARPTVAIAGPAALGVAALVAWRWSVAPGELRRIAGRS